MNEFVDIVVVGAGIHGAGVAQAAAAAGYHVLVLEKTAPAAGTSSRSSKLIHGGLRYLETGDFALVRESLTEREILLRNAPDLVRLIPFHVPVYAQTSRRPWKLRAGLSLYAMLGGFAPSTAFSSRAAQDCSDLGLLRRDGLQEIFTYLDAQTDDAALTCAVLDSAIALGAKLHVPARLLSAERRPDGYHLRYSWNGTERQCRCLALVNAAGPWVNHIQALIDPRPQRMEIDLVQGSHLIYDKPISKDVFYVESPGDRRAVFVMPWKDGTLVGTTEALFRGDPDTVSVLPDERSYLTEVMQTYFPGYDGNEVGAIAGLRVLPKENLSATRRSRETVLMVDNPESVGAVAIYGGKLTAYRATAEKTMNALRQALPERDPIADTHTLRLTAVNDAPPAEVDLPDRGHSIV
jgi:glycerol-3-phosphate dehydrogenase